MKHLKTQIEYRYTPILDFETIAKSIVSPYQRISTLRLEESNLNKYVLHFEKENFFIDFRVDRLIFITYEDFSNLTIENGPLSYYQSFIEKINDLNSFGKKTAILYAQWLIQKNKKSHIDNNQNFCKEYMKNITLNSEVIKDSSIVLDVHTSDHYTRIQFGPFNPDNDPQQFRLVNIEDEDGNSLNGLLYHMVTRDANEDFSIKLIDKMKFCQSELANNFKYENTD